MWNKQNVVRSQNPLLFLPYASMKHQALINSGYELHELMREDGSNKAISNAITTALCRLMECYFLINLTAEVHTQSFIHAINWQLRNYYSNNPSYHKNTQAFRHLPQSVFPFVALMSFCDIKWCSDMIWWHHMRVHSLKEIIEWVWKTHIKNDIHRKSHIEWMWAHPFNVDFPHWINEWTWEIHIDFMWSYSFNIELPADVVWFGFSIIIQWFICQSVLTQDTPSHASCINAFIRQVTRINIKKSKEYTTRFTTTNITRCSRLVVDVHVKLTNWVLFDSTYNKRMAEKRVRK